MRTLLFLFLLLFLGYADYEVSKTATVSIQGVDGGGSFKQTSSVIVEFTIAADDLIYPTSTDDIKSRSTVTVCKGASVTITLKEDSSLTLKDFWIAVNKESITSDCNSLSGSLSYGAGSAESTQACILIKYGSTTDPQEDYDYVTFYAYYSPYYKIGTSEKTGTSSFSKTFTINSPQTISYSYEVESDWWSSPSVGVKYEEGSYNKEWEVDAGYFVSLSDYVSFTVMDPATIPFSASLSPNAVDMVGSPYTVDVTITNTGSRAFKITDIYSTSTSLSVEAATGQVLDPGASTTITLTLSSDSTTEFTSNVVFAFESVEEVCGTTLRGSASLTVYYYPPNQALPDLTPSANYSQDGAQVTVDVTVINQGEGNATDVYLRVKNISPNNNIADIYIGELLSGEFTTLTFDYLCPDIYTVLQMEFIADPENLVPESDENNNVVSLEISCERPLPDLTPTISQDRVDDTVYLTIDVSNTGDASAENIEVVAYTTNSSGTFEQSWTIPSLNPAEVYTIPTEYFCGDSDELVDVRVVVDPANLIEELNEDNNEASLVINCSDRPLPDLTPSLGEYRDEDNIAHITLKVSNTGESSAENILVSFYITNSSGTISDSFTIPSLAPGEDYLFNDSYFCGDSDELVEVRAVVDPNNAIRESNEDNNEDVMIINCSDRPLPDLRPEVDYTWGDEALVDVAIMVINDGKGSTLQAFKVDVIISNSTGSFEETYTIEEKLNPDDNYTFNYTLVCDNESDITIEVMVDPDDVIEEEDEDNNHLIKTIQCGLKCELDPSSLVFKDIVTQYTTITCGGEYCDDVTLSQLDYYLAWVEYIEGKPALIGVEPKEDTRYENETLDITAKKGEDVYRCELPLTAQIERLSECRKRI
ncbi:MAG: hypothetical protein GXN92_01755 [Candidatus Micrarchaeota archaeon]|nr:hypothetical protein [Candidatus Micrarchaeota archaeon]